MAHIFDILSTINGQLNILEKDYNREKIARTLPTPPDFLLVSINRAIDRDSSILIDTESKVTIEKSVIGDTGDELNPVYLCVVDNIASPIIDNVYIMKNNSYDRPRAGTAYVLAIPKIMFDDDTTIDETSKILREIYFGVLDLDPNMQCKASPAIITLSNSKKIKIHSYDLISTLVAIGCMNINIKSWFSLPDNTLDSSYTLNAFTDEELPSTVKNKIIETLELHANSINDLQYAIGSGKLMRDIL